MRQAIIALVVTMLMLGLSRAQDFIVVGAALGCSGAVDLSAGCALPMLGGIP